MSSLGDSKPRHGYWRSLEELSQTPEARSWFERNGISVPELPPTDRRRFLQIMGASLALAGGLSGCKKAAETIVPYAGRPAGRVPGVPVHYATALDVGGAALGLLVTAYDGRPVKIEGNPDHPASLGATDAHAQASVLELYDPDRSQKVVRRESGSETASDWDAFTAFAKDHFKGLRDRDGDGLVVFAEASSSPSVARLRRVLEGKAPKTRWLEYEACSRDAEREGTAMVFGAPHRPLVDLERADVVVMLDADPFGEHPDAVRLTRQLASRRDAEDGTMCRLWSAESALSLSGSLADHRYPVRSAEVAGVALALGAELNHRYPYGDTLSPATAPMGHQAGDAAVDGEALGRIAEDLLGHMGRSVVLAGPRQPAAVHALCHAMNAALGNVGKTVTYVAEPNPERPTHAQAMQTLLADVEGGVIDTLVVIGGNPVYDAPGDNLLADRLSKVPHSVRLGLFEDETSQVCQWHLPRAHYLERWGDARAFDGTVSVIQPLIEPLYGGHDELALLALMAGVDADSRKVVRHTVAELAGVMDTEQGWRTTLHNGLLAGSAWRREEPPWHLDGVSKAVHEARAIQPGADLEFVFAADRKVGDGRWANSGWLQELPDPITKLVWDNAALISPADADALGLKTGDVVMPTLASGNLTMPVNVTPGQAAGSVTLPLGYGRAAAGAVGNGVGTDVSPLRPADGSCFVSGGSLMPTAGFHDLASTQDHYPLDQIGQDGIENRLPMIYRETDLEGYEHHPDFAKHVVHHPPLDQPFGEHDYPEHKWAMAVDLTKCTGCSTCVLACQAENNIPVVGREQIEKGREMHWLRIDRYFSGEPGAPQVAHMPVTCHHCENAPCEQVCPVAATVHDHEGLNVMVYNRCVGTRYCSNNCPYKVRRFNFHKFTGDEDPIHQMVFNPEVTVRSRGVMEKCSFCLQRINAVKIDAKNHQRPVQDGEIVPACAQACPAGAIVFGDLNDPDSEVSKRHAHDRSYALLAELNNRPRLAYLAKLRHPVDGGGGDHGGDHGGGHHGEDHGGDHAAAAEPAAAEPHGDAADHDGGHH